MIYLIAGKAGHGKDYTANILKNKLEEKGRKVLILHFADDVKHIARTYFGWDGEKDETGRTLLQQVGTELGRKIDKNIWVRRLDEYISLTSSMYDDYIVPDARFKNEIDYFLDKYEEDAISIKVVRLNYESTLTAEQQNHPSERDLDKHKFDMALVNGIALEEDIDYMFECFGWGDDNGNIY